MNNRFYKITILFLFVGFIAIAQNRIDSLHIALSNISSDAQKLELLNQLAWEYRTDNHEKAFYYASKAEYLALKIKDQSQLAYSYRILALVHYYKADYSKSLEYSMKSNRIYEKIADKKGQASALNLIALIYGDQEYFEKSLEFNKKSLKLRIEINDHYGIAGSYNNIGNLYKDAGNTDEAIAYFFKALDIAEQRKDAESMAMYYNNIASVYFIEKKYSQSFVYLRKSQELREKLNDKEGLTTIYTWLGKYYNAITNYPKAVEYLEKSLSLARDINIIYEIEAAARELHVAYYNLHAMDKAYHSLLLYKAASDSSKKNDAARKIVQIEQEAKYAKEREIERLQNEKREIENQRKIATQRSIRNVFIVICIAVSVILLLLYKSFKTKKKDNIQLKMQHDHISAMNVQLQMQTEEITSQRDNLEILNSELSLRNEEILTQRDEIEASRNIVVDQKNKIEAMHDELKDSIYYAVTIQNAVMSDFEILKKYFSDYFLIYKPKDIVSGDFYWCSVRSNWVLFSVADCTGHGVPGAFMSLLAMSFLNEIVSRKNIYTASQVLDELRLAVISSLKQTGASGESKDGADIAFCAIDTDTNELHFSGANSALNIIKSGGEKTEITEIRGDKQPIGIFTKMAPFTNHIIKLQKGDMIYLFSDGFADQFGGPAGKKIYQKTLKELLLTNHNEPCATQKIILDRFVENWKHGYNASYEQIDDITIAGIRI